MRRREFLSFCTGFLSILTAGKRVTFAAADLPETNHLDGITVIDTHSHPDQFYSHRLNRDLTSSMKSIKGLPMSASTFFAVGDYPPKGEFEESFPGIIQQLRRAMRYTESGEAKLVLKASDIPNPIRPGEPVGCILGLEGANSLSENLDRFNEVHSLGVRIITVGHYRVNDFTDIMTSPPKHGGLSPLGRKAIEKMDTLGIVIDVAHASYDAVKQIAAITKKPLVDSHTSPCFSEDRTQCNGRRLRSWKEIELVAKSGGIVGTWPYKYEVAAFKRFTFLDWAKEIAEMKRRFGIEYVALGTDGGGKLPDLIEGYHDVRDLKKLAAAMTAAGLTRDDISAYMGGNFLRVFKAYTG